MGRRTHGNPQQAQSTGCAHAQHAVRARRNRRLYFFAGEFRPGKIYARTLKKMARGPFRPGKQSAEHLDARVGVTTRGALRDDVPDQESALQNIERQAGGMPRTTRYPAAQRCTATRTNGEPCHPLCGARRAGVHHARWPVERAAPESCQLGGHRRAVSGRHGSKIDPPRGSCGCTSSGEEDQAGRRDLAGDVDVDNTVLGK